MYPGPGLCYFFTGEKVAKKPQVERFFDILSRSTLTASCPVAHTPRGLPFMAERLFGLLPALCTSSSMSVAQRGAFLQAAV